MVEFNWYFGSFEMLAKPTRLVHRVPRKTSTNFSCPHIYWQVLSLYVSLAAKDHNAKGFSKNEGIGAIPKILETPRATHYQIS